MNKSSVWLALATVSFLAWPASAQSYYGADQTTAINPWQDRASAPTGKGAVAANTLASRRIYVAGARAAGQSDLSVNPAPYPSAKFSLGFGAPGLQTFVYGSALPPVATSSVDLSICDAPPPPPPEVYDSSSSSSASDNLPPPPGPGYQPIYQHGVFVGYLSPELSALMQTDPASAWTQFANSSDFTGPEGLRLSLLAETGGATPEQMAELYSMAMF